MNLFKKKKEKPKPISDLIPKGLKHSIVPKAYLDKVGVNWNIDNKLYTNIIVIE